MAASLIYDKPLAYKDECFILLRKILYDFCLHPLTKTINTTCMAFHIAVLFMQVLYIKKHFSLDLVTRYGPMMSIILFLSHKLQADFNMGYILIFGHTYSQWITLRESFAWPLDSVTKETKEKILVYSNRIMIIVLSVMAFNTIALNSFTPLCGDTQEIILISQPSEEYFKSYSIIIQIIYFTTTPFVALLLPYHCFIFTYIVEMIKLQFYIINEYIANISTEEDFVSAEEYHIEIRKRLMFCIKQHINLKSYTKKYTKFLKVFVVTFPILGIMGSIFVLFFCLNHLQDISFINAVRYGAVLVNIIVLWLIFCWNGQSLIDETERTAKITWNLAWYNWNNETQKMFLVFLQQSTECIGVSFLGVTINYNFLLNAIRMCISYTLALFNLDKAHK